MAENTQTFTLVGNFKDNITPKLKKLQTQIEKLNKSFTKDFSQGLKSIDKDFGRLSKNFDKTFSGASKGVKGLENSLNDAGRAAGKVRDTVSQIGEGIKGLDGISESLEAAARAAGRAQEEVMGIGEAAGRANRQADDLMGTLLKAEGLSRFGDAMAQGFDRGMNTVMGTAQKGAGLVAKLFKDAMQDELADIKAASGIQGSFGMAGFKGDFNDSEKMYKKYDQVVSEMIRQSSAPTAKVVELQRYTLDTMGPLMLAAQGVKKGTAMKDIDPKKIEASAVQYGQFLEKAALFSQGTGSAGFRVAAGIEGLVTRGKIDTTIDFFTDNIMLMKNLEQAGFAGRGMKSAKMMTATDAQRMAAMMEAFNKSMSSESTAAMAQSLTGSLQGLQDTIFNPSVGILGMSVTYSKEEQKKANASIKRIQNARIEGYQKELKNTQISTKRREELENNIEQATATRDKLINEDKINTPFKAFSYAFTGLIQGLTNALNAIGPVWTELSLVMIDVTNRVFGPLTETLKNVASDMRGGKYTQMEGFGRIFGEIFKTIGEIFADLAKMLADPNSAMGKAQSEFMKGFMDAFKEPGSLEKAKKGLSDGINALISKLFTVLTSIITSDAMRPIVLPFLALMFGPPLVSAVIAGATPLIINAILGMFTGIGAKAGPAAGAAVAGGRGGALLRGVGGAVAGNFGKLGAAAPGAVGAVAGAAKMKGLAAVAAAMFALSDGPNPSMLAKTAKTVTTIGKRLPLLSIGFAGLDFAMRKDTEGVAKAGGGALGGLAGGAVGAAIGTAILPGIGTAVGGVLGTVLGDKLGTGLGGMLTTVTQQQNAAADKQLAAAAEQQRAAAERMRQIGIGGTNPMGVADPMKLSQTVTALGLEGDKSVQAYANATYQTRQFTDSAAAAKDKLFGLVENLKAMGYTNQQIWSQADVKAAVANYDSLQKKAGEAAKAMDTTFKAMPQTTSRAIMTAMSKMSTTQIEAAIAAKINLMKPPQINWQMNMPAGPGGMPTLFVPPRPTKTGTGTAVNPLFGQWNAYGHSGTTSLGNAINSEMRNKPKGSNLVIANSSETIIPAAGGMNNTLGDVVATLTRGFNHLSTVFAANQKMTVAAINRSIQMGLQGDARILSAIKATAAAGGLGGGAMGGAKGSLGAASALASSMGLTTTSGYRPGDPGYHGANRARDFSNGTGPTPQMLAFAQKMAATYGNTITELIYTPLGFGIKNGKKVPPYARAAHYNHVHVAFGQGPGHPTMFSSANAAMAYERMMAPAGASVASVTSNSSEWGNSPVTLNLTNNISGVQDPRVVAEMVWDYTSKKVQQLQNNSFA